MTITTAPPHRAGHPLPTAPRTRSSGRGAALLLTLSGLCFAAYPAIRPFSDEKSLAGARAFASTGWVIAHSLGIAAFALLGLGLFAAYERITAPSAKRRARTGVMLTWLGIAATLPYYGAEVFGLHAAGQQALRTGDTRSFDILIHGIRLETGIWFIVTGLLLLAAGTITFATATWREGGRRRWSAVPLAAMIALYIPQFAAAQPIRVAHGLLLAAACILLAWTSARPAAPARTTGAAADTRSPR